MQGKGQGCLGVCSILDANACIQDDVCSSCAVRPVHEMRSKTFDESERHVQQSSCRPTLIRVEMFEAHSFDMHSLGEVGVENGDRNFITLIATVGKMAATFPPREPRAGRSLVHSVPRSVRRMSRWPSETN